MAAAGLTHQQKDEACAQFLSMTEDRVDPEVAQNLLEAVGWNVQAAMEQLYGGPVSPGESRPTTAPTAVPAALDADEDAAIAAALAESAGAAPPEALLHAAVPMSVESEEDAAMEDRPHGAPFAPHAFDGVDDQEAADAHLAAVLEASYREQTESGRAASEEELVAQAMKISQQEEDTRQRQALRQQQEEELQESILMDRMREEREREDRKQAEEAALAMEQSRLDEERRQQEEQTRVAQETEAKRARLPAEPPVGEPGRVAVLMRLPGGQRLQRAFRSSDTVLSLYDFIDIESADVAGQRYRLVQTMPRKAFEDRQQSLQEAGVQNQCALMVELSSG
mmetsp:Transcript_13163/g.37897  ORF Transcript_13163/g.37897 Transcript_13163/m.37897 type:complete len:338 (+) Transcript_13163:66-1079(+)